MNTAVSLNNEQSAYTAPPRICTFPDCDSPAQVIVHYRDTHLAELLRHTVVCERHHVWFGHSCHIVAVEEQR